MTACCETGDINEIIENSDVQQVKKMNQIEQREEKIGRTKIRWVFYSEQDQEKVHYWGRSQDNYIVSQKYPTKTGRLVKEIMKNVKSSVILTSPSCLIVDTNI